MEQVHVNLLTTKKYHVIHSKRTNKIYVDKNYRCYLFETERDAKGFCEEIEDTFYEESEYIKQAPFTSMCYANGIKIMRVKNAKSDTYMDITIEKEDVKHQYYNSDTNAAILRLKQTNLKKYSKALKHSEFICPIIIDQRATAQHPVIHYAFAKLGNNNIYYLLFTTIQEFKKWNDNQGGKYLPIQTTFNEFRTIRGTDSVLINPESDRLVLSNKNIEDILKE